MATNATKLWDLGEEMEQDIDGQFIRYTTKEILERVDKKLDGIKELLDKKANSSDMTSLELRVLELEKDRVSQQAVDEATRQLHKQEIRSWWLFVGLIVSLAGVIVQFLR